MAIRTGTLVNDVKSPYSSPYVHYSCTYSAERDDSSPADVSVTLRFKGWLHSSASFLGTGIVLLFHVRLNGGSWKTVTVKSGSDSWNGNSTVYSAPAVTLTGSSASGRAAVEFYVSRGDSGGNSGKLGTAKSPKKYSVALPASGGGDTPSAPVGRVFVRTGGLWKQAAVYVKSGGVWKQARAFVRTGGLWKQV